jgi:hypothetical protein
VTNNITASKRLDLFGVRSWTPSSFTLQALKASVKVFDSAIGQFANGTVINASS